MEKKKFEYTYSAKQQQEIQNIRKKYLPKEEDKMELLRRLDKSAARKGTALSVIVGTAGISQAKNYQRLYLKQL